MLKRAVTAFAAVNAGIITIALLTAWISTLATDGWAGAAVAIDVVFVLVAEIAAFTGLLMDPLAEYIRGA